MNPTKPNFKMLFLCTGNSARSIMAEYISEYLISRQFTGKKFEVCSAGSSPKPHPHPLALKVLRQHYGIEAQDARSKSWEEFRDVEFDFVITLCDNAKESCPLWPGQPILAHWGSADPALVTGTDEVKERAFWNVAQELRRRLEIFFSLPFDKLDAMRLGNETREIGSK